MTLKGAIDGVVRQLSTAPLRGEPQGVGAVFSADARFEIAADSQGNPIAVNSHGAGEFRPLLTLLMRTFRITNQVILSMLIDGSKAAVHWRANVYSRITGAIVPTEFMNMVEVQSGSISSYIEFFVPR